MRIPTLVAALTEQAHKVWHVSNLYRIPGAERLADRLCAASFADFVFFCNSGTEAIEGAIKMARKYHAVSGKPERFRIVTFEGAFHGRTLATLAATGNKKYLDGFGPPVEGFDQVPFADLDAVKKAIGPATAAILIEPVMGEGGVRVVPHAFLRALRELCDKHGLLLIFDEVQTGIGRTGELFAYQHTGVEPDIMTLAKALGGGFPIGAFLATAEAAKGMTAGTHGSTFGGNPLAMAVGQCRARRGDGRRLPRPGPQERAAAQAAAGRIEGPASFGDRRGARRGPADRPAHGAAGRRDGRRIARREDARCRPPATMSCGCCRRSSSARRKSPTRSTRIDRACARLAQAHARPAKQEAAS